MVGDIITLKLLIAKTEMNLIEVNILEGGADMSLCEIHFWLDEKTL